uniref:nucleoside-diphosphate kinase n=1 Tax=Ursus americanus TaxID=9643 RepID=A0A452R9L8_URSAM
MANSEYTFIAIKPDGVQCSLLGESIKRFEQKGFFLIAMKLIQASEDLHKEHYIDPKDHPFFASLVKYLQSGPVVAMAWKGLNVVNTGQVMLWETNPHTPSLGPSMGTFASKLSGTLPMAVIPYRVQRRLACDFGLGSWWIRRAVLRTESVSDKRADLNALPTPFSVPLMGRGPGSSKSRYF